MLDDPQVAPLLKEYCQEQPVGEADIAGTFIVAVNVDPAHTTLVDVIVGTS